MDIIDGSHASYHQQQVLKILFPYVASNGLYVIEDLLWQPDDLEVLLPGVRKTRELLKDRSALDRVISGVKEVMVFTSPIQQGKEGLAAIIKE